MNPYSYFRMIIYLFLSLTSSFVLSINDQCNENTFILISHKYVFLINFDNGNDYLANSIYETKFNEKITTGSFHQQTNTIILLINSLNQNYSFVSLKTRNKIDNIWIEKTHNLVYPVRIHFTLGQRNLYVWNQQIKLLEVFKLPIRTLSYKTHSLLNLPNNEKILKMVIDENYQSLWILYENIHYASLYQCNLKTNLCELIINMFDFTESIQMIINWKFHQFYIYSNDFLYSFQYNHSHVNYTIEYTNYIQTSTIQFLTICHKNNLLEYLTINHNKSRQICFHQCQNFVSEDSDSLHTIERLSTQSDMFYCSKRIYITKIIIIILISIDLLVLLGVIIWLTYKYLYQPKTNNRNYSNPQAYSMNPPSLTSEF